LASIIGVVLCVLAALVALGNVALIVRFARTRKAGSLVPLFGGLFGAVGIVLVLGRFSWLALLALLEPGMLSVLLLPAYLLREAYRRRKR
jgi:formate hydrogenlyase subunit 3/multisubunit Na+/H+ antiporter MnhD subunit